VKISAIAKDVLANGACLIRPRELGEYDVKPLFSGKKRGWVILDATTAAAINAVHEALANNPNRDKFDRIPLGKLVDFCWKHVKMA
jgi:hypothetical protein